MTRLQDSNRPMTTPRTRRLRDLKSVPVLPSLITLGNLFFGFLAMAKIMDLAFSGLDLTAAAMDPGVLHAFQVAALLIMLAMVFDALDGRVARMTGQTSAFGAQLDSLADMITFGLAPAFIAKVLINFHHLPAQDVLLARPKLYYVAASIYVLCAAMRLARFNVESAGPSEDDHKEFRGLPSPGAAAFIAAAIAFFAAQDDPSNVISQYLLPSQIYDWIVVAMPASLVCLGLLMVSKVPYPHAAYALLRQRHSFPFLATLVVVIGLGAVEWQFTLFAIMTLYVLSGVFLAMWRLVTTGRIDRPSGDDDAAFDIDVSRN